MANVFGDHYTKSRMFLNLILLKNRRVPGASWANSLKRPYEIPIQSRYKMFLELIGPNPLHRFHLTNIQSMENYPGAPTHQLPDIFH